MIKLDDLTYNLKYYIKQKKFQTFHKAEINQNATRKCSEKSLIAD